MCTHACWSGDWHQQGIQSIRACVPCPSRLVTQLAVLMKDDSCLCRRHPWKHRWRAEPGILVGTRTPAYLNNSSSDESKQGLRKLPAQIPVIRYVSTSPIIPTARMFSNVNIQSPNDYSDKLNASVNFECVLMKICLEWCTGTAVGRLTKTRLHFGVMHGFFLGGGVAK